MLSWKEEHIDYGIQNYHWKSNDYSSIIKTLDKAYGKEGLKMYTMTDFKKQVMREIVPDLGGEEMVLLSPSQVKALNPAQVQALDPGQVKALDPGQVKALNPAQVKALDATQLKSLDPEQLITALSSMQQPLAPEQRALIRKMLGQSAED